MYGRDIANPLPSPASVAASCLLKDLTERVGLAVVVQMGSSAAISAKQERIETGNICDLTLAAHIPAPSVRSTWISQGCYAEVAWLFPGGM